MQRPVQDEADEVAEVLGVERAARRPAHVVADGHRDLLHFTAAPVTAEGRERQLEIAWNTFRSEVLRRTGTETR